MIKTKYEIYGYRKTKYRQRKDKENTLKKLITIIIVVLFLLFLWSLNEYSQANASKKSDVQLLRNEIQKLRESTEQQFDGFNKKLLQQDQKLEGIKVSKAEQRAKQPTRLVQNQRPNTGGNCEQWRPLVSQYPWDVNVAMAVMRAESTQYGIPCNANAENKTDNHKVCLGSRGLFQIGCDSTTSYHAMFDPIANVAQAYQIYARRGWSPWGAYTNGSYLRYL